MTDVNPQASIKNGKPVDANGNEITLNEQAYAPEAAANEEGNKTDAERKSVSQHRQTVQKADEATLKDVAASQAQNDTSRAKTVGAKAGLLPNMAAPHAYVENGIQRNSTEENTALGGKTINVKELTDAKRGDSKEVRDLKEVYSNYYAQNPNRVNDEVEKSHFQRELSKVRGDKQEEVKE